MDPTKDITLALRLSANVPLHILCGRPMSEDEFSDSLSDYSLLGAHADRWQSLKLKLLTWDENIKSLLQLFLCSVPKLTDIVLKIGSEESEAGSTGDDHDGSDEGSSDDEDSDDSSTGGDETEDEDGSDDEDGHIDEDSDTDEEDNDSDTAPEVTELDLSQARNLVHIHCTRIPMSIASIPATTLRTLALHRMEFSASHMSRLIQLLRVPPALESLELSYSTSEAPAKMGILPTLLPVIDAPFLKHLRITDMPSSGVVQLLTSLKPHNLLQLDVKRGQESEDIWGAQDLRQVINSNVVECLKSNTVASKGHQITIVYDSKRLSFTLRSSRNIVKCGFKLLLRVEGWEEAKSCVHTVQESLKLPIRLHLNLAPSERVGSLTRLETLCELEVNPNSVVAWADSLPLLTLRFAPYRYPCPDLKKIRLGKPSTLEDEENLREVLALLVRVRGEAAHVHQSDEGGGLECPGWLPVSPLETEYWSIEDGRAVSFTWERHGIQVFRTLRGNPKAECQTNAE